jgi:hypothetical protein
MAAPADDAASAPARKSKTKTPVADSTMSPAMRVPPQPTASK